MARSINSRTIYVLSVRRFVTWKAHSAYQSVPAAKLGEGLLVDTGQFSKGNIKIEKVVLNA